MANHARLNFEDHKALKVSNQFSAAFGDDKNRCPVFTSEFGSLQKEYAIFLERNSENGTYQAVVFLGFDDKENVYLGGDGQWNANYIPASIAKGPFLIGLTNEDAKIDLDLDHPKVGADEGHTLFTEDGKPTQYLDYVSDTLFCLHEGIKESQAIYQLWEKHDLISAIDLNINFDDGNDFSANHLLTINHEKLQSLSAEALLELNQENALEKAFWMLSSLSNVHQLMARRQQTIAA